ncbi:MAG: xylose isomerase [Fimbriimonadaceae bacterium]|jgi:xylose isomerase|nr:xylose isomerase [Fimbriimonadaceae bacterium]
MPYFPEVPERVPYDGPGSKNALAFKAYDAQKVIGGKTMAERLRFAVCYWHTFKGTGADPFGAPTWIRPWDSNPDAMQRARDTIDAAFEFMGKLGVPFWCFHDRDIAPEGRDLAKTNSALEEMVRYAADKQAETGIQLIWGTANLFSHPRYQSGAATNPDPHVFAWAGAQVRRAMDATHALGGQGYTFWGGRDGYETLLNTNMKHEREQLARFLHMAVDYKREIGFTGQLYIEPKPMEPMKHQYDSDAEACLNFLREFDLLLHFKLNVETNHATLAGHTMAHELQVARHAGALGSIDANMGDTLLGWDTDQFPTNLYLTTEIMLEVLRMGGFTSGGLNFDAKLRRPSHEPIDLFYAHIGGMDAFARGLEIAWAILEDGRLERFVEERYAGWHTEFGQRVLSGDATLKDCEDFARQHGEPERRSGRQEMLENLVNEFASPSH